MMHLFYDYNAGNDIVFTSEKKATEFIIKYKHWLVDNDYDSWIVQDSDYALKTIPVDTPFEEWIKENG